MKKRKIYLMILLMGFLFLFNACTIHKTAENIPNPPTNQSDLTDTPVVIEEQKTEPEPLPEIKPSEIEEKGSQKSIGFGVLMSTDETQPGIPSEWVKIFKEYEGYYVVPTQEKKIYLTFDLGYEAGFTSQLLDALKTLQIPATFFLLGQYIEKNPELVKRIVSEGHTIGNHSYIHTSIPKQSKEEIIQDTQKCQSLFYELTGKNMHLYRPPQGEFSEYSLSVIHGLGYQSIFWSVAYKDWEALPGGQQESYQMVVNHIHPGAIVLMHVVTKDNVLALPSIVQTLTEKGYSFASLNEL